MCPTSTLVLLNRSTHLDPIWQIHLWVQWHIGEERFGGRTFSQNLRLPICDSPSVSNCAFQPNHVCRCCCYCTGVPVSADWRRECRWGSTRRRAFRRLWRRVPDIRRPTSLRALSRARVQHDHEIFLLHPRRIRELFDPFIPRPLASRWLFHFNVFNR